MPARDQRQMVLRVSEIRQETPEIKSFRLDLKSEKPFPFIPGQFVIVTADLWNPKRNRIGPANRAFSLSSSPTEPDYIEWAAKRYPEGRMTTWLHDTVKVGDRLRVKGPEGSFVFREGETEEIILLAGGIGVAPFRSMIRFILDRELSTKIKLIFSARTPKDFAFSAEFNRWAADHPNFHSIYTVTRPGDDPWTGRIGRIDPDLLREHRGGASALYYLCGPDPMIKETAEGLRNLGIPEGSIRSERW